MSVYIRGMEMPTRCGRCDMCVTIPDGDIDRHNECCITGADILNVGEKMEDCPLIPVPPHGRLIDANFIVERLRKQIQDVGADTELANRDREFISIIGAVSTIIPADKEGEA